MNAPAIAITAAIAIAMGSAGSPSASIGVSSLIVTRSTVRSLHSANATLFYD